MILSPAHSWPGPDPFLLLLRRPFSRGYLHSEERRGAARNSRKNRPLQHVMMEVAGAGGRAREQPFLRVSTVVAFISNGNEVVFLMSTIFVCIIVCFFYTLVKVEDKHWRVRGRPRLAGFQIQAL